MTIDWRELKGGYPGEERAARAVFDVLAPFSPSAGYRSPIYEEGHETCPSVKDCWSLAVRCATVATYAVDHIDPGSLAD